MKKITGVLLIAGLSFAMLFLVPAQADETKDKAGVSKTEKKLAENEAKRRAELENTVWKVTFYSNTPTDKDAENGSIEFSNNQMEFKDFKKVDLGTIGYTLTAFADSDKGMLETYKTTKDGNISMRADWLGQIMNGVISEQKNEGKNVKLYRFTSVNQVTPMDKPEAVKVDAATPPATTALVSEEVSEKAKI